MICLSEHLTLQAQTDEEVAEEGNFQTSYRIERKHDTGFVQKTMQKANSLRQ